MIACDFSLAPRVLHLSVRARPHKLSRIIPHDVSRSIGATYLSTRDDLVGLDRRNLRRDLTRDRGSLRSAFALRERRRARGAERGNIHGAQHRVLRRRRRGVRRRRRPVVVARERRWPDTITNI